MLGQGLPQLKNEGTRGEDLQLDKDVPEYRIVFSEWRLLDLVLQNRILADEGFSI
jgi:hypothetical protein